MKFGRHALLLCLLVSLMLLAFGCGKDTDSGKAPAPSASKGTETKAPAQAAPAGTGAVAQPAPVDIQKPIAEVQTQAQAMNVESLKATAQGYKDAILAKQADVEKLMAKVKEIPITEALGEQAKTLKGDLSNLETSVKALKERFQVYYNTLKEKGGDVSGLTI
jgi:hypothetical protein